MTEFAAHDLAKTVLCKVAGCTEQVVSARGRYAKLCDTHRKEKADDGVAAPSSRPAAPQPAVSIRQAAQKLVPVAANLDKALGRRRLAREDARAAFAVFKAALDELHQAAREAVA